MYIKRDGNIVTTTPRYHRQIITNNSFYHFASDKKSQPAQLVYGNRIVHHSFYYFSGSNQYYFGNRKVKAHVYSSSPYIDSAVWKVDTTITHIYKGYRCAKAYSINSPGDTNKVLYTPDIQYPPNFNRYKGLPGVVLELYNTYRNVHTMAISIEKGPFEIVLPAAEFIRSRR